MHAIWFSIFVPALVASVWIGAKLRRPQVWFVLTLITVLATVLWVGNDLLRFAEVKGSWENAGLRTLYLFVSEPDKPALQLIFGFSMAALFSRIFGNPTDESKIRQEAVGDQGGT